MIPAYDNGLAKVFLGNDLDVLEHIPDGSIDLAIYSPPYNLGTSSGGGFADSGGRTGKWGGGRLAKGYANNSDDIPLAEYEAWQKEVLLAVWGKLSLHGAIFLNHKNRVQNGLLWEPLHALNPGLPLRQTIIWTRPGGVNFSPTHFCPTHEVIGLFAKPAYRFKNKGVSGLGDVWHMLPEPSEHSAPFPLGLPARAIEASAGVTTILDPYCGSGTTLRAASDAGLHSIGIDNDPACIEMTARKLAQLSLFEVAPGPQIEDTLPL